MAGDTQCVRKTFDTIPISHLKFINFSVECARAFCIFIRNFTTFARIPSTIHHIAYSMPAFRLHVLNVQCMATISSTHAHTQCTIARLNVDRKVMENMCKLFIYEPSLCRQQMVVAAARKGDANKFASASVMYVSASRVSQSKLLLYKKYVNHLCQRIHFTYNGPPTCHFNIS